jgi:3-methyladenine DNA glycosylase Tag
MGDCDPEHVEALMAFVEDPEGVASMSREEVRAELAAEGIVLDAHQRKLQEMMRQTRGQERLARIGGEVMGNLEAMGKDVAALHAALAAAEGKEAEGC